MIYTVNIGDSSRRLWKRGYSRLVWINFFFVTRSISRLVWLMSRLVLSYLSSNFKISSLDKILAYVKISNLVQLSSVTVNFSATFAAVSACTAAVAAVVTVTVISACVVVSVPRPFVVIFCTVTAIFHFTEL